MLPRLVGLRRAMELVLLNPRLDAPCAPSSSDWSTPCSRRRRSTPKCLRVAARLADGPTGRSGMAKALINQAAGMDRLDAHLDRELEHLVRIADGAEFAEGLDSFFEKRAPRVRRGHDRCTSTRSFSRSSIASHAEAARARRRRGAPAVSVRIGELSGVDFGLLATAFDDFRDRTICERRRARRRSVAARWAVPALRRADRPRRPAALRALSRAAARLAEGDEIVLDRIEMEVA